MGCSGSRDVVAPAPSSGVDVQQQQDSSTKPWKKNQVVPLQEQQAGQGGGWEAAAPSQQQAASKPSPPAATTVAFGKDAAPALDQGKPADVFKELQVLCEQKLSGAPELANLAERLHELIKLNLAVALRAHSQPKDSSMLREVAERCVACANIIMQPLLTHITRVLSNRQAGSSWSEGTSWDQMEFADFLGVLEDACNATYEQGVMEVGRPLASLMDILHQLHQHCDAHKVPLAASVTQVSSLNELLGMLGIIYFRKVVLETAESASSKLDQYQQLQEQVGWSDSQLATCTGPEARAMLLYLQQVSVAGEKRTNVTVRRSSAFWDAFECARRDGLLPASSGSMCHKYFPLFVDEFAAQAGTGRKPAVEAGEGHGPRKEFFSLAGQDMAGQHPPTALDSEDATAAAAAAAAPSSSSVGDAPAKRPHPPLWVFNRTAGSYWYNTGLTESPELKGAYAFAGWLMGQSLLNRAPLGLPLPAVLFRGLLEGGLSSAGSVGSASLRHGGEGNGNPGFQPTLETLAEFDPDAATAVRNVAALPADQLAGMLELEGLPAGWNAEQYTAHAVAEVLRDGVAWQSAAVAAGFFAAVDRRLLRAWQMSPAALAALVSGTVAGGGTGSAPVDLSALFRVALDEELAGHSSLLVELLWEVLVGWPGERRLRFVEFVTGTARLPLPGSELLKIQAPFVAMGSAEHKATLGMLPQAHTCDNLLELPNYWESLLAVRGVRGGPAAVARGASGLTEDQLSEMRAEARRILDERLEMAVLNFQGYGLDERSRRDDDDDEDDKGTGGDQSQPGGRILSGPEPSPEPELPLTPAALTADSLASLARLSQSSSMLQHSHPLAFSNALGSPQQQTGQSRGRRCSQNNAAAAAVAAAAAAGLGAVAYSPAASPTLARYAPQLQPPPQPLQASVSAEERQRTLMAAFDVDEPGQRSVGAPRMERKETSSSEESQDALAQVKG